MATIVNLEGLAKALHIAPRTVRLWRKRGQIPSLATQRPLLFDLDDVVKALKDKPAKTQKAND